MTTPAARPTPALLPTLDELARNVSKANALVQEAKAALSVAKLDRDKCVREMRAAVASAIGRGPSSNRRRLTNEQVIDIRAANERGADIARRYGICEALVSNIRNGKAYVNVK